MKNSKAYRIITQFICIIATAMFLFPLVLMLIRSFEVNGFKNYIRVFKTVNLFPNFKTSILVVFGTLSIVALITSMAAFAFSKLNFKGREFLFYLLITGMMIPAAAVIFPLFQIVKFLGVNNTPLSLIFPYAAMNSIFNLIILRNYFDSLPDELMEASYIDGASNLKIYSKVILPLGIPGLTFVLIQTFLSSWNELQMAMVFINNTKIQPISVVPLRFVQTAGVMGFPLEIMYASLVICLSPVVVFYIGAQRFFLQGLIQGAIKG